MPQVSDYNNQEDWMKVCVPQCMSEGLTNEQAVGKCMGMWENKDAMKSAVKGWVTINGSHVLVGEDGSIQAGGGGGLNKGKGKGTGWASPHDEFRFVQRRLAAGNLKRGERKMLERRSERLAKEVLGVKD